MGWNIYTDLGRKPPKKSGKNSYRKPRRPDPSWGEARKAMGKLANAGLRAGLGIAKTGIIKGFTYVNKKRKERAGTLNVEVDRIKTLLEDFPIIDNYKDEFVFKTALSNYLSAKGEKVELEKRFENIRIDIVLHKDYGIELKYNPDQNELNRLMGQAMTYRRYLDHLFIVIFSPQANTIQQLKKALNGIEFPHTIIAK